MVEIPKHPFFIATQFHPEFKSRPNHAHPLFRGVIDAAVQRSKRLYQLQSEIPQAPLPELAEMQLDAMEYRTRRLGEVRTRGGTRNGGLSELGLVGLS